MSDIPQGPLVQIRDGNFSKWMDDMKRKAKQSKLAAPAPPRKLSAVEVAKRCTADQLLDMWWMSVQRQAEEFLEVANEGHKKLNEGHLAVVLYSVASNLLREKRPPNELRSYCDLERARRLFAAVLERMHVTGAPPIRVDK